MAKLKKEQDGRLKREEFLVDSLASIQRFFGIAHQTSKDWKNQGVPTREDGLFDLQAVFVWWLDSGKWRYTKAGKEALSVEKQPLETQKLEVEVEHKRLKLEQDKGQLVIRDMAHAKIISMIHKIRTRLEAIPGELAASLPPESRAEYVADATAKVKLILREMENWSLEED